MSDTTEEKNEIDEGFKEYIAKVKPPDGSKAWMDYCGMMWANAYSMGVEFTIKAMEVEFKKAELEKGE